MSGFEPQEREGAALIERWVREVEAEQRMGPFDLVWHIDVLNSPERVTLQFRSSDRILETIAYALDVLADLPNKPEWHEDKRKEVVWTLIGIRRQPGCRPRRGRCHAENGR